jgi:hypothetical protein
MVDIRGEWDNSIQKFCLIADLVTYLVGVAEKDPSDFLLEQGLLVGTTEYFSKSHVLKREYDDEEHRLDGCKTASSTSSTERIDCIDGGRMKIFSKLPNCSRDRPVDTESGGWQNCYDIRQRTAAFVANHEGWDDPSESVIMNRVSKKREDHAQSTRSVTASESGCYWRVRG